MWTRRGLIAGLAGLAVAGRARARQADAQPIRIGLCLPISAQPELSASVRRGVERSIAVSAQQQPGLSVSLRVADEQGGGPGAKAAGEELIRAGCVAILGTLTSASTRHLQQTTEANGTPLLLPTATEPALTTRARTIRVCFADPWQADAAAALLDRRGVRRLGVLSDSQIPYAQSIVTRLQQRFSGSVHREFYSGRDLDLRAQWKQFRRAKVEAIYFPGYYPDVAAMAPELRRLGFKGLLCGADGWASAGLLGTAEAREALEGAIYTDHFSADDPDSGSFVADWASAWRDPQGAPQVPGALSALGYDAARLLLRTIEKMGAEGWARLGVAETGAREELVERLLSAHLKDGATGGIRIGPDREPIKPVIFQEIRGGAVRFLERLTPEPAPL